MVFHSESEISRVPDKPSLENRLDEVTLQSFENDTQCENEEDYDYDDEEDDEWDWNDSGGRDFTKRYTAMRTGNNPQVNYSFLKDYGRTSQGQIIPLLTTNLVFLGMFRLNYCMLYYLHCPHQANRQSSNYKSTKMSTPSDKVLRKYENKINLGKLCINLTTNELRCTTDVFSTIKKYIHIYSLFELSLCFTDKLSYADSVINKVTLMQKQREADTYVILTSDVIL